MAKNSNRSEAQKKADAVYYEKNRYKRRKTISKSHTKKYINEMANIEELTEVKQWIEKRMKDLKA